PRSPTYLLSLHELFRSLAKFLGAGVGIVIRAGPVDGHVFGDDFVFSLSRDRDGGNMRVAAQSVAVLSAARELNDFERASQVDIQALLLRFAIQRCGAVDQGIRGVNEGMVFVIGKAKTLAGQVAT